MTGEEASRTFFFHSHVPRLSEAGILWLVNLYRTEITFMTWLLRRIGEPSLIRASSLICYRNLTIAHDQAFRRKRPDALTLAPKTHEASSTSGVKR